LPNNEWVKKVIIKIQVILPVSQEERTPPLAGELSRPHEVPERPNNWGNWSRELVPPRDATRSSVRTSLAAEGPLTPEGQEILGISGPGRRKGSGNAVLGYNWE
jgi:hypothetical protein